MGSIGEVGSDRAVRSDRLDRWTQSGRPTV